MKIFQVFFLFFSAVANASFVVEFEIDGWYKKPFKTTAFYPVGAQEVSFLFDQDVSVRFKSHAETPDLVVYELEVTQKTKARQVSLLKKSGSVQLEKQTEFKVNKTNTTQEFQVRFRPSLN